MILILITSIFVYADINNYPTIPDDGYEYFIIIDTDGVNNSGGVIYMYKSDIILVRDSWLGQAALQAPEYTTGTVKEYKLSFDGTTWEYQSDLTIYDSSVFAYLNGTATDGDWDPVESNYDLYNEDTSSIYFAKTVSNNTLTFTPKEIDQNGIYIQQPLDGFKDFTDSLIVNVYYKVEKLPGINSVNDFYISIPNRDEWQEPNIISHTVQDIGNYFIGFLQYEYFWNVGTHTIEVKLITTADNFELYNDSITVERTSGFVDTNNDGLDDTTNLPDVVRTPPITTDEGAFNNFINGVRTLASTTGEVPQIFNNMFAWIPNEIRLMLISSVALIIILKVMKR